MSFIIEADAEEDKGSRHTMEDAWVVLPDASLMSKLPKGPYLMVFGKQTSCFCRKLLQERKTTSHFFFAGSIFPPSIIGNHCKPRILYLRVIYYASPTLASAMQNSVPAITLVMASALRLEHVNIVRRDGLAKILGTIASVGGATIITLYKGPPLLLHQSQAQQPVENNSSAKMQNSTWGCIYLLGHCLSWAGWMVFQAPVVKKYPAKLSLTSFTCFFGLIQFLIIAAFVERDPKHWKIQSGEEIFTVLYAGIMSSGIVISLQTWCIHKGGPVFVAIFQPVQRVLVAIMAFVILGDQLYSGGIMGAILIMIGL